MSTNLAHYQVLNVYSQWCGPCISTDGMFLVLKLGPEGENLHLANCNSDTICQLQRFNRTSMPIWLIVRHGKAVNIAFGSDADELAETIMAELKFYRLGIKRQSYGINELQPVEIETHKLLTEMSLLEWLQVQGNNLNYFVHNRNLILNCLPNVRVTLFGPHVQSSGVYRDVVRYAESLDIRCLEKRYIMPTEKEFQFINYECGNPLEEDVLQEFYDKFLLLCIWNLPEGKSIELFEQFLSDIQTKYSMRGDSDITLTLRAPKMSDILIAVPDNQFKRDQKQFYDALLLAYGNTIDILIDFLPNMASSSYNRLRVAQLIYETYEGDTPYLKFVPLDYDQNYAHSSEESKKIYSHRHELLKEIGQDHAISDSQRNTLFNRIYEKPEPNGEERSFDNHSPIARKPIVDLSRASEIFEDEGIDKEFLYLLEEAEEFDESLEEEHVVPLRLPAVWWPNDRRTEVTLIYLYFKSFVKHLTLLDYEPPPSKQIVMGFKRNRMSVAFAHSIERHKKDILDLGYFTGGDPEESEFVCTQVSNYKDVYEFDRKTKDVLMMSVKFDDSRTALDLQQWRPIYVSPNELYGKRDADNYFGSRLPDAHTSDFVDFLRRQKINFYLWKQQLAKRVPNKWPACVARKHYAAPTYKIIRNAVESKLRNNEMGSRYSLNQLEKFLIQGGMTKPLVSSVSLASSVTSLRKDITVMLRRSSDNSSVMSNIQFESEAEEESRDLDEDGKLKSILLENLEEMEYLLHPELLLESDSKPFARKSEINETEEEEKEELELNGYKTDSSEEDEDPIDAELLQEIELQHAMLDQLNQQEDTTNGIIESEAIQSD